LYRIETFPFDSTELIDSNRFESIFPSITVLPRMGSITRTLKSENDH